MTPLFPTSVCGSMPRPQFVRDLIAGATALAPADRARALDAAIRYVVALQESAGLDVVTDGEWRRKSYLGVIADIAAGFELSVHPDDGRPMTCVTEKLTATHPGFIAREIRFLQSITTRQIKATLPSPALLGERLWDPVKSVRAYPSRDDFVRDCVPILRHEIELTCAAGADIIQIDDPHLCLFVDPEVRRQYAHPDRAADFAVDMTNAMIAGIAGTFAVHLCRRAGGRARGEVAHAGGYGPILHQLNRLQVQHLTMEFTAAEAGEMDVLRTLREDVDIGLGCIDVTPGVIDTVASVVARVEAACQHVDPQRLTLNPDCGFAPGSGANVDMDEVYRKLQVETAAATVLRQRYT